MPCRAAAVALFCLAACASYDPPVTGDHTTFRYQTDLQRCRKQADAVAARAANATPTSAVSALFASGDPTREQILGCMKSRGYQLAP